MIELYGLAPNIRIVFSSLLVIAIILQTMRLFMLMTHHEHRISKLVIMYEMLMLAHFMLATSLVAITLMQRSIVADYLYGYRYGDVVIILFGAWIFIRDKRPESLICSLFLILTLPGWSFNYGQIIFLVVNLYLILRTFILTNLEWQKIKENITRLSIKETVDLLPGGILYANRKGELLIVNPTMSRLLTALNIETVINTLSLWENLMGIQDSYNVSVQALDDKLLVRIRNAGSWLFSKNKITVGSREYVQLLAVDITDEDVLNRELEESNNALEALGEEISLSMNGIDQLEKEREVLRIKTRVHDILAQRLSILSRLLESDMEPESKIKNLKPLLTDLTGVLTGSIDMDSQGLLSSLIQSFKLIGTEIHIRGSLPENEKVAQVFTETIRECSTNAVRHANANNVFVDLGEDIEKYTLLVQNDGAPPVFPIVTGGGIEGMRNQVNEVLGKFSIESDPAFHIRVSIPKNREGGFDD